MKFTKKQITWSIILVIIVAACVVLYYIGKSCGWFAFFETKEQIQQYVSSFGALAPLAFFLLQFFQVIVSPIPGNLTTIAGGFLFGPLLAFFISTAAIFLGSIGAFGLGKAFGKPLVERIAGKAVVDKYMNTVSSRQKMVLIFMFLLPFFPDDVLCLIAGLSAMKFRSFALIMVLTRPWGILLSVFLGAQTISIPDWGWVIIVAAAVGLFILSLKYAPVIEERIKGWLEKTFSKQKEHKENN